MPPEVREALKANTTSAIATLRKLMENSRAKPYIRLAAANSILDRAWGIPRSAIDVDRETIIQALDTRRRGREGYGGVEALTMAQAWQA